MMFVGAANDFAGAGKRRGILGGRRANHALPRRAKGEPPTRLPRTVHFKSERAPAIPSSACAGWLMRWMASKFCSASTLGSGCATTTSATFRASWSRCSGDFVLLNQPVPPSTTADATTAARGNSECQRQCQPALPGGLPFLKLDRLHHPRGEIRRHVRIGQPQKQLAQFLRFVVHVSCGLKTAAKTKLREKSGGLASFHPKLKPRNTQNDTEKSV